MQVRTPDSEDCLMYEELQTKDLSSSDGIFSLTVNDGTGTQLVPRSDAFGKAFEHFIIQEIKAYLGYGMIDIPFRYWRTQGGQYEVDCVLGDIAAIEIKAFENFNERSLAGLKALQLEKKVSQYYLVSRDPVRRMHNGIEIIPFNTFLDLLWSGEIISNFV